MDILTYTDGYENRIDHDFVKYELRVPIQEDVSPQSNIESQGVGGTARFTEYNETSCNFKGVHKTVRFYLVQNIPMKCWIGWPQLVTFHAVIDALEGTCELKALGVTLASQKLCANRNNQDSAVVCTFTPMFSASVSNLDIFNS